MARILVGATGSVAAIRIPPLVQALGEAGHDARVVATEPALYFFDPASVPSASQDAGGPIGTQVLFRDQDEWPRREGSDRYQASDPVLHIELRRWAELLLIAPLDANTMAKITGGLCDNLLTSVYRAWDRGRPIILAPAMNTFMWENPLTERHLRLLLQEHCDPAGAGAASAGLERLINRVNRSCPRLRICPPQSKQLACGDEGMGAMAEVGVIVEAVREALASAAADLGPAD